VKYVVSSEYVGAIFFFQAEDGIRDKLVTGVQTCALPISPISLGARRTRSQALKQVIRASRRQRSLRSRSSLYLPFFARRKNESRSEERRVGKECRARWSPEH